MKQIPKLEFSVSATTRAPRGKEKHGVDYFFMKLEAFKEAVAKNQFTEWEEVYENQFYGTLKSELQRIWNKGNVVVFDVDVVGGLKLKKIFKDEALAVFIQAPSTDALEQRLRARATDDEQAIQKRLQKAVHELEFKNQFDCVIVNDELERAKQEICNHCMNFLKQ